MAHKRGGVSHSRRPQGVAPVLKGGKGERGKGKEVCKKT